MDITRLGTGSRMSMTTIHNGTVYLAGQVADDAGASVSIQTQQVLEKISSLLDAVGSGKSKILSATIWLTDVKNFDEMNAVWDAWVDPEHLPVRACVGSALAAPGLDVEIMVIAAQ
tara:strand:- start:18611 stop:18958 length:348 start_codon:yes stop_codon:yes gene_type:complete